MINGIFLIGHLPEKCKFQFTFNGRLLERRFLAYRLKGSGVVRRTVGQKRPLTQEGAQARFGP